DLGGHRSLLFLSIVPASPPARRWLGQGRGPRARPTPRPPIVRLHIISSLGDRRLVSAPGGSRCPGTRSCASAARRPLRWCSPSRLELPPRWHARPVAVE